jgi:4-hydroxybenzoate polyprenyltransferase
MGLALLLIFVGIVVWLLLNPLLGLILFLAGIAVLIWAAFSFRGTAPRRYWY